MYQVVSSHADLEACFDSWYKLHSEAMTAIGASGANREVLEQAFRKNSVPNFVEPEELWQKLQKCDKGNYLMASFL